MFSQKIIYSLWLSCIIATLSATAPTLIAPTDQSTNISKTPTLQWSGTGSAYTVEIYACNPDPASTGTLGLDNFDLAAGPTAISEVYGDLSGLTYNSSTNSFFAPTNGIPMVFELGLDGSFIRSITLNGFQDTEGLVWVGGNDYFIIEERKGRAVKITIDASTTSISYPTEYIQLPGTWGNNLGLEGISYNPSTNELIIIKEKSPLTIYAVEIPANLSDPITVTNPFNIAINNFGFTDLSGLHHLGMTSGLSEMNVSNHFLVLSHESTALVETDETGYEYSRIDLSAGGANGTLGAALFQAEGVSADDQGNIYVVSEPNTFYKFSNPSFDPTPFNTGMLAFSGNSGTGSSLTVPAGLLDSNTEYCWRVQDNSTGEWSEYWSFTTAPNAAPSVTITTPTNGAIFTNFAPIPLSANASDPDGNITQVEFFVDNMSIGTSSTGSPYTINFTPTAEGTFTIYAVATDNEGATTPTSTIDIIIDTPNQAPNITLTNPTNGATFNSLAPIPLSANASDADGNIAQVEFFVENISVGTSSTGSPYTINFTPSAEATYTIYAVATDNEGATTPTSSIDVIVDLPNQAPTITIISPPNGLVLTQPDLINIITDANDPDGTIAQVDFYINGINIATVTSSPFSSTYDLLIAGNYCIAAIATDNEGATTTSSVVCVELDVLDAIEEEKFFSDFQLFPNPAQAELSISYSTINPLQDARLLIFDSQGKQLMAQSLNTPLSGQYSQLTDISRLASGTYVLAIEQNGQILLRRRFVKG